jgi:hypothetical protein
MGMQASRIVVVENEPVLLMGLQDLLTAFGCQIVASESHCGRLRANSAQPHSTLPFSISTSAPSHRPPSCLRPRLTEDRIETSYATYPRVQKTFRAEDLRVALLRATGTQ